MAVCNKRYFNCGRNRRKRFKVPACSLLIVRYICLLQLYNEVLDDPLRAQHSVLLLFLMVVIERKT